MSHLISHLGIEVFPIYDHIRYRGSFYSYMSEIVSHWGAKFYPGVFMLGMEGGFLAVGVRFSHT